ncbi:MAG: lysozyme inhibitor LprI family protein [Aminobacteriaceae bacterium]
MRLAAAVALILLLLCGTAWCEVHPIDAEIEECMNKDPSTQGTIQCANMGKKKWDGELNRVYNELMKLLPKEGQGGLRTAQRAWIPWRESEFKLLGAVYLTIYNNLDGGTMWLVANAIAEMEVVRGRTLELLGYISELKKGKPSFNGTYPAAQTKEQLDAALKVKSENTRLGKAFGANGEVIAKEALDSWEDFRNREAAFQTVFYGKKGDRGFPLHSRMLMNVERVKKLQGLYEDLRTGGLKEDGPEKKGKENAGGKEPFKGDRTLYQPSEGTCDFGAYIIDPDPKGANVRDAPNGKLVRTLPWQPDDPALIMVTVTGFKGKWLSVVLHDGTKGWIFSELVGMSLRNYAPGAVAVLRTRPEENAPAVGDIFGDEEVTVLGGEGKWALVQYRHPRGHVLTGWLEPEKQCDNPYTTCP